MGFLDDVRGLVWPSSAPLPQPDAIKALSDATVPRERSIITNWPWQDGMGFGGLGAGTISLAGPLTMTYAEIYESQLWVNAAVNRLAEGIGMLPLKAYRRAASGQREREYDGDLARLIERPYARWSAIRFKHRIITDLAVYGNAVALKIAANERAVPSAIKPVTPVGWWLDADGMYRHRDRDGNERRYEPWRVIHWHFEAPGHEDAGVSRLRPLRRTLAIEYAAQLLGVNLFEKGAMPSGGLSTDQDLNDEQIARLAAQFRGLHAGVGNAGKAVILANGLKWTPFSYNLNDSAVIEHRKLTRDEVAAVYHVPPSILGNHEHSTFSNVEEMHREWYQDSLAPYRTLYEETLQVQLIDPCPALRGRFVEFDTREVLKGNIEQQTAAYQAGITGGWLTANEVRRLENLPPSDTPGADELHFPLNLSGSQQPAPDPAATQTGGA